MIYRNVVPDQALYVNRLVNDFIKDHGDEGISWKYDAKTQIGIFDVSDEALATHGVLREDLGDVPAGQYEVVLRKIRAKNPDGTAPKDAINTYFSMTLNENKAKSNTFRSFYAANEHTLQCECCKQKRERNDIWFVRNTETGDYHQVGSSCIDRFNFDKDYQKLVNAVHEELREHGKGTSHSFNGVNIKDYLAATRVLGFVEKRNKTLISKAAFEMARGNFEPAMSLAPDSSESLLREKMSLARNELQSLGDILSVPQKKTYLYSCLSGSSEVCAAKKLNIDNIIDVLRQDDVSMIGDISFRDPYMSRKECDQYYDAFQDIYRRLDKNKTFPYVHIKSWVALGGYNVLQSFSDYGEKEVTDEGLVLRILPVYRVDSNTGKGAFDWYRQKVVHDTSNDLIFDEKKVPVECVSKEAIAYGIHSEARVSWQDLGMSYRDFVTKCGLNPDLVEEWEYSRESHCSATRVTRKYDIIKIVDDPEHYNIRSEVCIKTLMNNENGDKDHKVVKQEFSCQMTCDDAKYWEMQVVSDDDFISDLWIANVSSNGTIMSKGFSISCNGVPGDMFVFIKNGEPQIWGSFKSKTGENYNIRMNDTWELRNEICDSISWDKECENGSDYIDSKPIKISPDQLYNIGAKRVRDEKTGKLVSAGKITREEMLKQLGAELKQREGIIGAPADKDDNDKEFEN